MNKKTRRITLSAIFSAFSVIFLYIASVYPAGRLGIAAAASLFAAAAVIEAGVTAGAAVFTATTILSLLLVPDKNPVILYALFFGYYPVVKSFAEKKRSRIAEWCIKLLSLNAGLTAIIFIFSTAVFNISRLPGSYPLIYLIFNAVFVVFDFGVSRLIGFYTERIARHN